LPFRSRPWPTARGARACALLLVVALVGLAATSCGKEPVTIPTQRLTVADQAACQQVTDALPDAVADQDRRHTQPAEALGGAWGDPPIVLECGVGMPAGFTRTSGCQEADGVGWFVPDSQIADQSADVVMATAGYRPVLQVTIPASYRPSGVAAAMVELAPVVKKYTTLVHPCH
jgi:hypothetical protein